MQYLIYIGTSLCAGAVTSLTGLSAAIVMLPILISLCHWTSYEVVTVALVADACASLLLAYLYYKNKKEIYRDVIVIHTDTRRGFMMMGTTVIGTIIGSFSSYLLSLKYSSNIGYISVFLIILLGLSCFINSIFKDKNGVLIMGNKVKTTLIIVLGSIIGWIYGFTGIGGSILILTILTALLGYNLKMAVGASALVIFNSAFIGTIHYMTMKNTVRVMPLFIMVAFYLLGILLSKKVINTYLYESKKFNQPIGLALTMLSIIILL